MEWTLNKQIKIIRVTNSKINFAIYRTNIFYIVLAFRHIKEILRIISISALMTYIPFEIRIILKLP